MHGKKRWKKKGDKSQAEVLWHHPGKATSSVDSPVYSGQLAVFGDQRLQRKTLQPMSAQIQECSELGSVNYICFDLSF